MFLLILLAFCSPLALGVSKASPAINPLEYDTFISSVFLNGLNKEPVSKIIYGNPVYGYYRTDDFSKTATGIIVRIVPPGYKLESEFYAETLQNGKSSLKFVTKKSFTSRLPKGLQGQEAQINHGQFTSNYFIVAGALPRGKYYDPNFTLKNPAGLHKSNYRFTFVQILNRLGETVWMYIPKRGTELFQTYIHTTQIKPGVYAAILGKKAGMFFLVDFKGKEIANIDSKNAAKPFTMHHDFAFKNEQEFYAISTRSAQTKSKKAKALGETFLADTIIKVNLVSQESTKVFDFLPTFKPHSNEHWAGDDEDDQKFVLWNEKKVDFDFLHINSLQMKKNGALVSLRNLNKIVMLKPDFSGILWTMGLEKSDTFRVKNPLDQFQHIHTPHILKNGNVLIFDNGQEKQRSRINEYALDIGQNEAKLVWSFEPENALYSKDRSSIAILPNNNILAYYVNPNEANNPTSKTLPLDILIEIDPILKKEIARMTRTFDVLSPGYRAEPIKTIGLESYLGQDLKNL